MMTVVAVVVVVVGGAKDVVSALHLVDAVLVAGLVVVVVVGSVDEAALRDGAFRFRRATCPADVRVAVGVRMVVSVVMGSRVGGEDVNVFHVAEIDRRIRPTR